MPFTAGHPAAVLPLVRSGLPASALVIGTITPDLPMMLPIPDVVHFAHTPLGLVTVDLILGTIAFVLWQVFFGPAAMALAPRAVASRIPEDVPRGLAFHRAHWDRVARVLAAVLTGAATHLIWDGVTHDWMWGPQYIPWLASQHGSLTGWQWVQRFSDVAGTAIVAGWLIAWWHRAPKRAEVSVLPLRTRVAAWLVILCPATVGFVYWLLTDSLFAAFARGAGPGTVGLVVVTAIWWVHARRTRAEVDVTELN
ncbi:DUF4184 family protein [Catellatospora sichuanensis]|uniref:DUF4184 family protein n=1 Tax=Catellatospora sichuanensis TaxID=1969805 RepID=UPI00118265AA|nr:DUF4184 family protein [Catellatospora sichuanensis]